MDKWCEKHKREKRQVSLEVWICPRCLKDRVRELERKNRKRKEAEALERQRMWDFHFPLFH